MRSVVGTMGQIVCYTEILKEFSEEALNDVLLLEKTCFPVSWQYPDAAEYYREKLMNPRNINIFSKYGNQTIGYMITVPFADVLDDLKNFDHGLRQPSADYISGKLYIETSSVLPDFSKIGVFNNLINTTIEVAIRRDAKKFCVHARVLNNVNCIFRKKFAGKITEARSIDAWRYGGNEPYEYLEWVM